MTPQELFDTTLALLKKEENTSCILINEKALGKKWNYSICATPINIGKPLIIGINWGGGGARDNFNYLVQDKMPTKEGFLKELKDGDYKFLSLSKKYLKEHLNLDICSDEFNYSNLFFFRTPNIKYLKDEDFKISIPILKKYVEELQPEYILSLGNTNMKYLSVLNSDDIFFDHRTTENLKVNGYIGKLWSKEFYCLPHPSAHIHNTYRDEIWGKVFPKP